MNKTYKEFPIIECYEKYQTLKQSGTSTREEVANARKITINSLVAQDRKVLDNPLFLELIEDERAFITEGGFFQSSISKIVALTKALRMHLGKEELDLELVRDLLNREFFSDDFRLDTISWFIDLLFEREVENESDVRIVRHMARTVFKDIEDKFFHNPTRFYIYNEEMQKRTDNLTEVRYNSRHQRTVITNCLAMFLMNLSLGDETTAKFFLMKAELLNFDSYDNHAFINLAASTFLFNEGTQ